MPLLKRFWIRCFSTRMKIDTVSSGVYETRSEDCVNGTLEVRME